MRNNESLYFEMLISSLTLNVERSAPLTTFVRPGYRHYQVDLIVSLSSTTLSEGGLRVMLISLEIDILPSDV